MSTIAQDNASLRAAVGHDVESEWYSLTARSLFDVFVLVLERSDVLDLRLRSGKNKVPTTR